jgi:SAM-dependent methyltransferase
MNKKDNVAINPDNIWRKIVASEGMDKQLVNDLRAALVANIRLSKLFMILEHVKQLTKENMHIRIMDYGCGGGQLLTYLRVLGYTNLTGIDVGNAEKKYILNTMHNNMGFKTSIFFIYDGVTLPFSNLSFDIVISQQVLEHVHNVERYFSESGRVLSPKGQMLLEFPHRLVPFDTHTRMWFVHYFPLAIRDIIYDKYRKGKSKYYNDLLNLQPIWYYKKLLNTMFSRVIDVSEDRIENFAYQDHYEGNIHVRIFVDKLIHLLIIGKLFKKIFSVFSSTTLVISK